MGALACGFERFSVSVSVCYSMLLLLKGAQTSSGDSCYSYSGVGVRRVSACEIWG